ncbi:MAG: hypothetical protein AB7F43_01810 [Bacteriovoracia bacterium]
MPIKEYVNWGFIILAGLAITKGPQNLVFEMKKLQYQMLREVGRTNNWGNPSIFKKDLYSNRNRHKNTNAVKQ